MRAAPPPADRRIAVEAPASAEASTPGEAQPSGRRDPDHGERHDERHGPSHDPSHGEAQGHARPRGQGRSHAHAHAHSHAPSVTSRNERAALAGFLLTFGFMFAEAVAGWLSGSLALIADAGHMLTDAAALALAWAGFRFGRRAADSRRTFGYMRFEVLAGFVNAVALMLLVAWIAWEAARRLLDPAPVLAGPMIVVATLGLAVNAGVFWMLAQGDRGHVNIKGAMLHVLGDLLGSVAAILAGAIIWATGWTPVDPILSVLLSALILRSGWALLKTSLHILMEGAPAGLDAAALRRDLVAATPGLADVSHIHVWSITSGQTAATLHVALTEAADPAATVRRLKARLAEAHGLGHSTVEIDWDGAAPACPIGRPAPDGEERDHGHGQDHGRHDHGRGQGEGQGEVGHPRQTHGPGEGPERGSACTGRAP